MDAKITSPCFNEYGTPSCTKVSSVISLSGLRPKPFKHTIQFMQHQSCDKHMITVTRPTTVCSSLTPVSDKYVLPTLEHSLSVGRAAVLETGPLPPQDHSLEQSAAQSQTMWSVTRSVQAVTEDIFIWTAKPRRSVSCFLTVPNRNTLTYLLKQQRRQFSTSVTLQLLSLRCNCTLQPNNSPSLPTFRRHLKTHYFQSAYPNP